MFQTLLAKLARALDGARIPYMVVGGQAVLVHGEPRLTRDIDVTLGVDNSAFARVLALGGSIGLSPSVPDVERFVQKTNVLPLSDESASIRVDLIFSFTPYEAQAIGRAISHRVLDISVRFATAEDLIVHKLVAGRPRDLEDVRGILSHQKYLDETYLDRWLPTFREVVERDLLQEYKTIKGSLSGPGDTHRA
jgi:hypothetical protein